MKIKTFFKTCLVTAVLGSFVFMNSSCQKNAEAGEETGTITGTVTNTSSEPIEGVSVSVSNSDATTTTAEDGTFTLTGIPVATLSVTFSKEGYQTTSVTVSSSRFENNVATISVSLAVADAKITGTVYDGANGDVPFGGVKVTLNDASSTSTTTAEDGSYTIENLTARDYTLTFSAEGYISATVSITSSDFNNDENTATVDATLYTTQLLPGKTIAELQQADKWYYNEYRGGTGGTEYPRWDWSTAFMGALDFYGVHDEISEGTDLVVDETNYDTVDLSNYVSYVWGSKLITEDNNIMTVRARTFSDRDGATVWSAGIIDLSEAEPTLVKIGDNISSDNTDYEDYHFDLSAYNDKEIIIAIGVYCSEASQEKHFAIKRINFTATPMSGWDWIYGTDVVGLEGWHLTQEMVRSTMPNEKTSFSGITNYSNTDDRVGAYQSWRENDHIGATWGFMALTKDTEIFASQGAIIKTRGSDGVVDTSTPESYFYSKFTIGDNNDQITLRVRTFGSYHTYFKLTAITVDELEVKHLTPSYSTTCEGGSSEKGSDDGCWKFINTEGEADSPENYATFTFDLSAYSGKDIILSIAVFKGEENSDENKLCFYSVEMN